MKKLLGFGPLFVILAAFLWSFDGIFRIGLTTIPSSVIVFYEHFLGALFLVFLFPLWIKDLKRMTRKEWTAISIVALFSGALGTIFYTAALTQVHNAQYSIVVLLQQQIQPIWAILAAAMILREPVTKRFIGWALVALVAAYFVTFKDLTVDIETGSGTIIAGFLALCAGFMWGTSTAISKVVLNKVSSVTGTALRFFLIPLFAFLFIIGSNQTPALFTITSQQLQTLIILSAVTGLLGISMYYYGLKRTPARITTLCELVYPANAILIDYFYFHKSLSLTQILGVLLLLLAIYQITKPLQHKASVDR